VFNYSVLFQGNRSSYLQRLHSLDPVIDREVNKALAQRTLTIEARRDLATLKRKLLSDTAWRRSDGALAVAVISGAANAFANLLLDLLPKPPAVDLLHQVVYTGLHQGLSTGYWDAEKIAQAIAFALVEDKATAGQPVRQMALALGKFANGLAAAVQAGAEQAALKSEVAKQVAQIEAEMRRYEEKLLLQTNQIHRTRDEILHQRDEFFQVHEFYRVFVEEYSLRD
jgi:hypothetical protein